jgi:hypothetical protein
MILFWRESVCKEADFYQRHPETHGLGFCHPFAPGAIRTLFSQPFAQARNFVKVDEWLVTASPVSVWRYRLGVRT